MILDRYISSRYLGVLGGVLLTFLAVFILVDLFDNMSTYLDKGATSNVLARYYFYQIPYILQLIMPISALISCFFAVGGLAATGEIDAMRAAGRSLLRILLPVFVCGLGIASAATYLATSLVPVSERVVKDIKEVEIKGRPRVNFESRTNHIYFGRNGWDYQMHRWDGLRQQMQGVQIFRTVDGEVVEHLTAKRGNWEEDSWVFEQGVYRIFQAGKETEFTSFDRLVRRDLLERPEDFSTEKRNPRELTLAELRKRVEVQRRSGEPVHMEMTNLHLRLAFPLSSLVLVLLGAPLSTKRKKGGAWVGFTIFVVIGFVFFGLTRFLQELGEAGRMEPLMAAWAPDAFFASLGLLIIGWRQRGH